MALCINLRFFALLTVVFSFLLYVGSLVYSMPLIYIPNNASTAVFVSFHLFGIVIEAGLALFLFMHMLIKSKLDFHTNG
ncbi:MAG: hypothetical protein HRT43_13765 [Campylobacteraceae bacterium]|nr:hypothetical protein [Campylobacteraceae bacterium]